MHGATIKKMVA